MYQKFLSLLDPDDLEVKYLNLINSIHQKQDFPKDIEKLSFKKQLFTDKKLLVKLTEEITLDNPLIVGAGWDKQGLAVRGLHQLGFASVVVGTVTPHPQLGNPKPRYFEIAPGVSLNRYGFNSPGADVVAQNLKIYQDLGIPIGISAGKNKEVPDEQAPEAYAEVIKNLYHYASYFELGVSSPNTPGLRKLQDKKPLGLIIKAVNKQMDKLGKRKPIFIKIAPDMSFEEIDDVIEVALANNVVGISATNTTINSNIKSSYGQKWSTEDGGLAGNNPEFRKISTEIIAYIYRQAGKKLKVIGAGGIMDTKTALEKILAGATALEIVTGLSFVGPTLPGKINQGLVAFIQKRRVRNLSELVGQNSNKC